MQILKRYAHFFFATKVWLTSVLLTPFLFCFTDFSPILGNSWTFWEAARLMVVFGGVLSIPNWILFILITWLIQKNDQIQEKKTTIMTAAILLSVALFYVIVPLVELNEVTEKIPLMPFGYMLTLVFGIYIFPLRKMESLGWENEILDDNLY